VVLEHSEIIGVCCGMNYENYDDARSQLMDAGLLLDGELKIGGSRSARCKVEGRGKEKRGWYWLHDVPIDGCYYLVGAYGVYEGNSPGTQKIELTKQCEGCKRSVSFREKKCPHCGSPVHRRELSKEQYVAYRARVAENMRREEARRWHELDRAARSAEKMWINKCLPITEQAACEYLVKRGIQPHKTRMTPNGTLVVPMQDVAGRVWGLQFIGPEVRKKLKDDDKQFWPYGTSQTARFFMLCAPGDIILICEGFVTGAALHEETGLCVVVAFTAGNLQPVADVIHKKHRSARILICADDDFATRGNPGVSAATLAAMAVGGAWVAPQFPVDEPVRADIAAANIDFTAADYKLQVEAIRRGRKKLTDFDDLRSSSTPHTVRLQIEAKLAELEWAAKSAALPSTNGKEGEREALKPIASTEEIFKRFALIYGHKETVFDLQERMLLSLSDMRNACIHKEIWRRWMESNEKTLVRTSEVGFDPTETDKTIKCNLWGGWPTQPRSGRCTLLLELLEYLCSNDDKPRELFNWTLKWIALPIQNPGKKMSTALLLSGPNGCGKNMFFGEVRKIYGRYGGIFSQTELESKFNSYLSGKLFLIGNEVLSPSERQHLQSTMKNMVTEDEIQIDTKGLPARLEKNHCNFVFLSNMTLIVKLDRDDRRYNTIYTPPALSKEFYAAVAEEIRSGGTEALHDHLLNLDLGEFGAHSPPPLTRAKCELIDLSLDSSERFFFEWSSGHLEVPFAPCRTENLYEGYRIWANKVGISRAVPQATLLANLIKKPGMKHKRARHYKKAGSDINAQSSILIPPGQHQPADNTEITWLSNCIYKFNEALAAWRDGN
jgi:putative DNA primase/helicase